MKVNQNKSEKERQQKKKKKRVLINKQTNELEKGLQEKEDRARQQEEAVALEMQ